MGATGPSSSAAWRQVCALVLQFREEYQAWPTRVLLPRRLLVQLDVEAGPDSVAALRRKLSIVAPPLADRLLAYDEMWRFAEPPLSTPASTMEVEQWLGWPAAEVRD